ncbi:hypothetical protein RB195_020572 [Necator americanus]|uniref:Reverse transcriptase domain-containing protein n=1 Tax=Necator americanus TaxID=51031 RepID=A0ABR1CJG6_NECAM
MQIITERFYSNIFRSSTPVSLVLANHMTFHLQQERIPDQWKFSRTIVIHGKGARKDFRNYRPKCLLIVLHKIFIKIILTRTSMTLDGAHLHEQAGFHQRFNWLDNIYRLALVLTFVDYENAFDSVETNAILSAPVDQDVDASYVRTIPNCYVRCTTRIQLFHRFINIPIGKGVRQGDTTSPKLFTAALQWIRKPVALEEGIHVGRRFPSNFPFADDIVLFSRSTNEAETMLKKLDETRKRIG